MICEKRSHQTEDDVAEVEKICKKVITVERRGQWGIGNIAKTAFSKNSFLVTGHTHQDMKQKIGEELGRNKFDLIHVETFYVMQNLPKAETPIVLAEHNIEYQVYKKYVDKAAILAKPFLALDVLKIKNEEKRFWQKANKVVAVSESDAEVMRAAGIEPAIVANGVDVEKFAFLQRSNLPAGKAGIKDQRSKKILFIGDFKWLQNRDAAKFIVEEIWPEIKSKIKDQRSKISLWIVGRKIPDSIKSLTTDPDIIFDEESSKKPTEEIFQEADVLLAPIRIGGGTSYKILEAMSCGTPVVTTTLSADAIEAKDGEHVMIGETASELAEKTVNILSDKILYEQLATNGRKLIEERYTWGKIAKELERIYESIVR